MRKVSKEECGSRLGEILNSLAEDGPVAIQHDGEDVAIVLTPDLFSALTEPFPANVNPRVVSLLRKSLVERWQVYKALSRLD